jgi:heme/copper-type cytochrome/quinol oxidase subunit 2
MVYSRVIRAVHGEHYSFISPRWCTRIFVFGDIVCLSIQSTGGSVAAKPENADLGSSIIVGGLVLQCVVFAVFMYCCMQFHMRFRSQLAKANVHTDIPWEPILYMLYTTSVLITIRNIFRLIEFIMGKGSYLYDNEWPVYVFDGALMLIVMVVFFKWYPNQLQTRNTESMIELTSDEVVSGEQGRTKQ